jgi:hypothetical protein
MTTSENLPSRATDVWTMTDARAAVLAAVDQARTLGALTDEAAQLLAGPEGAVAAIPDLYALRQLVDDTPALDEQFCRFPSCFHPRRPAPDGGGNRPAYCDVVRDPKTGKPAHDPVRSMRARRKLESGDRAAAAEQVHADQGGERPVSLARATIPETVGRVEHVVTDAVAQVTRALSDLRQQVAAVGNPEMVEAEIQSVRHDANTDVQRAVGAQLAAEKDARAARAEADKARRDRDEAVAAAEEAIGQAEAVQASADEQAERDRLAVEAAQGEAQAAQEQAARTVAEVREAARQYREQLQIDLDGRLAAAQQMLLAIVTHVRQHADAEIAQVRADAEARIRKTEADAAEEISRVKAEAAGVVAEAQAAQEAAEGERDTARREMEQAKETATRADADAANAKAELQRARDELTRLNQQVDQARADARAAVARADATQKRLDDATTRHEAEQKALRDQHAQARDDMQGAHDGVVTALKSQVQTLAAALETAKAAAVATVPVAKEGKGK